jgi:hypothetical protein
MIARVVAVEPTVTFTTTLREAEILRALVGGVGVHTTGVASLWVRDVLECLTAAGIAPSETFSDYFTGKVETKAVLVKK